MRFPPTGTSESRLRQASGVAAAIALAACATAHVSPDDSDEGARRGIVTVRVHSQKPDPARPWKRQKPTSNAVEGIAVDGHRILLALSLQFATYIEVQKGGEGDFYPARIVHADPDVPLALLTVDDSNFWTGVVPAPLGVSVPRSGTARLARWSGNGMEYMVVSTKGIDAERHAEGSVAPVSINLVKPAGSNTTGIVFHNGVIVGLVASNTPENLRAIGVEAVRTYLSEAQRPDYQGFARVGFYFHSLTNPAMRSFLGLGSNEHGIQVSRILPWAATAGGLLVGDVVLRVEDHPVDDLGRYEDPRYGRVSFAALFAQRRPGQSLAFQILRGTERLSVTLPLHRYLPQDDLIPQNTGGETPRYLVRGGLVFVELFGNMMGEERGLSVRYTLEREWPTSAHRRLVILSDVLPDPANIGYQNLRGLIVDRVNGVSIRDIADVEAGFKAPQGEFDRIDFAPGSGVRRIVLDASEVAKAERRVKLD